MITVSKPVIVGRSRTREGRRTGLQPRHGAGDTFDADLAVADADDFDGLVLPGATTNPDKLRLDPDAVALVKSFVAARKPVAAICHGPWTLVEADVLPGKTPTSWPNLHTDIVNAGGTWQDVKSFTCPDNG